MTQQQQFFITSTEVQSYIAPFTERDFWEFKRRPEWPKPVKGNGGKEIYYKPDIDRFLLGLAGDGK